MPPRALHCFTNCSSHRPRWGLLFAPASVSLLTFILIFPLVALFAEALGGGIQETREVWAHLAETVLWEYTRNTLQLMALVLPAVLFLGTFTAWVLNTFDFPGSKWLGTLLVLPLAFPTYILAYVYADTFQYVFPAIRSLPSAALLFAFSLYPYVYLPARAAFSEQSAVFLDAARTLGCNRFQAFLRVTLPLSLGTLISGGLFVVMEVMADFGTVDHLAIDTLSTGIYRTWFGRGNLAGAVQLAMFLLLLILLMLFISRFVLRRQNRLHHVKSNSSMGGKRRKVCGLAGYALLGVVATPVALGFGFPMVLLCVSAATTGLDIDGMRLMRTIGQTLWVAFCTTAACLLVGYAVTCVARVFARSQRIDLISSLLQCGYALPGTVVAVAAMTAVGKLNEYPRLVELLLPLIGTLPLLVFAHTCRYASLPTEHLKKAMGRIPKNLTDVARTFDTNAFRIAAHILLPLSRPTAFAASALVFVDVMKELPTNMLLAPFQFETLSVYTYNLASDERLSEAAPAALMIVLAGLLPVWLLTRGMSVTQDKGD